MVFEEWWEVWAMDGEWRASSGANRCEEATFLQIEKVTKLKAERGMSRWLLYRRRIWPWQGNFCWNGVWRRDWWNGIGVGGVKRRSSNESAWGLRFSYIFNRSFELAFTRDTMENPKDTINWYIETVWRCLMHLCEQSLRSHMTFSHMRNPTWRFYPSHHLVWIMGRD
jgi:hypothetical protein